MANITREHRESTRKAGNCQRCGESAKTQYTVKYKDGDNTDADSVVKGRAPKTGTSHYCAPCAKRRVAEYVAGAKARAKQSE